MPNKTNKKGFTLIEIVIVLAIAALIMVVVFLAVQGAQRGQRDQAVKDTVNRIGSQLQSFQGNNNGTYPTSAAEITTFMTGYVGGNQGGGTNNVTASGITMQLTFNSTAGAAVIANGTTCSLGGTISPRPVTVFTGNRPISVSTCLEAGSQYTINQ